MELHVSSNFLVQTNTAYFRKNDMEFGIPTTCYSAFFLLKLLMAFFLHMTRLEIVLEIFNINVK